MQERYCWARARLRALDRPLPILPRTTGRALHHVLPDGQELIVFAYSPPGPSVTRLLAPGDCVDVEVLIHHDGEKALEPGAQWHLRYEVDKGLGSGELLQVFGSWASGQPEPQDFRGLTGRFLQI